MLSAVGYEVKLSGGPQRAVIPDAVWGQEEDITQEGPSGAITDPSATWPSLSL